MGNFGVTPMPEAGSTKHENPPIPPFVKGGWGDFHINLFIHIRLPRER
jgi:hypothetical protein